MLIGWLTSGTAVPEIPTGFALGMTDLGERTFVWAGQSSNLVGGGMPPPYRAVANINYNLA